MISIKDDLGQLEKKLGRMGQGIVPKAASQAINRAIKSVNSDARREVARETGVKQKELTEKAPEGFKVSTANRQRLQATIDAAKARARNLIEYVRPAQRKPNYFNARTKRGKFKAPGVKAKAWGSTKTYRGAFIQQASSNGKMLVLKRKQKAGRRGGTTEGVAGPSPRSTFAGRHLEQVMERKARERLPIELTRSINNELRKLK